MPNTVNRTGYSSKVKAIMDSPLCEEPLELIAGIGLLLPNDVVELSEKYPVFQFDYFDEKGLAGIPWARETDTKTKPIKATANAGALLNDIKNGVAEAEKKFTAHLGAGDEMLREYGDTMLFSPSKRLQKGWTLPRICERINIGIWRKEFGAYLNLGLTEEARKKMAYADVYFPINRLAISADRVLQMHLDYFEKAEQGGMNAEEERRTRTRLLEEELRTLSYLQQVTRITDPVEGERIQSLTGIGNPAQQFHRYANRGIRNTYSDTEARIAGLKNGWPIEDLNALSSFKISMDMIYMTTHYENRVMDPRLRKVPAFRPGEREYLDKMQKLWARIETTKVQENETRMQLLKELQDVITEGADKKFIAPNALTKEDPDFLYPLYDINRKIARQLTPSELEVMNSGLSYDAEEVEHATRDEADAQRLRREEYEERQRQEQERKDLEAARKQQREEEQAERERQERERIRVQEEEVRQASRERGVTYAAGRYDRVVEEARRRRQNAMSPEDIRRERLLIDGKGEVFFYHLLKEKRDRAARLTPISAPDRATSDQNDILRYYMAKKDLSFDQALDLQLISPEDRRELAEDYYDDLIAHPLQGVAPGVAEQNARYLGELNAAAAQKLLDAPFPAFDPADPEQVKNFLATPFGRCAAFTKDFNQNEKFFRSIGQPSHPIRAAYLSAFGSRDDFARIHGQMAAVDTLSEFADAINIADETVTPLKRAVELHFLQKMYAEVKGRPLSQIPADKWIEFRAAAQGIMLAGRMSPFPMNGAPSDRDVELFLAGKGPSPFTEEYLKQFDPIINEMKFNISDDHANRRQTRLRTMDPARIYNLSHISQHVGPQPSLGPDGFERLSGEQRKEIHRVFDQTLGNCIGITETQGELAAARGESVYDRFTVNGEKTTAMMRRIYGERFDAMTGIEKEHAMEAELLRAYADPQSQVKFLPLEYDRNGAIREGTETVFPRPEPQKVTADPVQPPDADTRLEIQVALTERNITKLDRFLPGMIPTFGRDYLPRRFAAARDPEQVQQIKRAYLTEAADAAEALASAMQEEVGGVSHPEFVDYIRLQENRIRRGMDHPEIRPAASCTALMGLVDNIHIAAPDAVDEKQPGPVFRALYDQPDGKDPFPLISAAQTAEKLTALRAEHADKIRDNVHPLTADEDKRIRTDLLRETVILDAELNEMERVARRRGRNARVLETFDDPEAVKKFMNGNPGLRAIRAENEGRITAITQGWPVEDIELIAGIFAKREVVNRALETMPEGTGERLSYERVQRVLNDICDRITATQIENADRRNEMLAYLDSYGSALYNDVTDRYTAFDAGQETGLKNAVREARERALPAEAFRTAEENSEIWERAEELKEIRRQTENDRRISRVNEAVRKEQQRIREKEEAERAERERERQRVIEQNEREEREAREAGELRIIRERQRARQERIRSDLENELGDDRIDEVEEEAYEEAMEREERRENEAQLVDDFIDGVIGRNAENEIPPEDGPQNTVFENGVVNNFLDDLFADAGAQAERAKVTDTFRAFLDTVDYGVMPFEDDSFETVFANEEEKKVSAFAPTDAYIRMLSEDEDFFGGLFEQQQAQREVGYSIDGNGKLFGFFEWQDINSRLKAYADGEGKDLQLKTDRLPSVTNDCRIFLMGQEGLSFDEVMALNTAHLKERRGAAGRYLDALEAHPLHQDMTQAQREGSARFYGDLHRKAAAILQDTRIPALDITDRESFVKLHNGPNPVKKMSGLILDFTQDIEALHLSNDPAVRAAYLDGLGGPESLARIHENSSLFQGIDLLSDYAGTPVNRQKPLRNAAYARYLLEQIAGQINGKKLSEIPMGMANHWKEIAGALGSGPLPEAGAPTEQELNDYLDGKIPSPFSQAYLAAAEAHLNDHNARISASMHKDTAVNKIRKLKEASAVFTLPYIPIGPHAERPRSDYANLSPAVMHDTHVVFDRIFGGLIDSGTNGQVRMSVERGENFMDRFVIDGVRVSRIPQIAELAATKTPEELRIFMEAEVLQAMADPGRNISYVPLAVNAAGQPVEQDPADISWVVVPDFENGTYETEPAADSSHEAAMVMKYTIALSRAPGDLGVALELRPDDPRISPETVYELREAPMFYGDAGKWPEEGEMDIGSRRYVGYNHIPGTNAQYFLIHGLMEDGSLTEEGRRNFKSLTDAMNAGYDGMQELAAEWDAKNPMLAEMIRASGDSLATEERGVVWIDLLNNYTYRNLMSQLGTLHLTGPTTGIPFNSDQAMKALQGYPTGESRFPLPQAISAGRKMAIAGGLHEKAKRSGTLTKDQDRLARRMVIAELEETKRQLKLIDAFYLSQFDENGNPDPDRPGYARVREADKLLENDVFHASSYYPRGTRLVHSDLDARHTLIALGWPLEDMNALSHLFVRRDELRGHLNNPSLMKEFTPEQIAEKERALKVLGEICDQIGKTEIRSQEDRKKVFDYIDNYGDLFYNDTLLEDKEQKDAYRREFDAMKKRPVSEFEFMTEEELQEYRRSDALYQAQKDGREFTPTMNGPRTDGERAFLDVEKISSLIETRQEMDGNTFYESDPALRNARTRVRMFMDNIARYYGNGGLSAADPAERERVLGLHLADSSRVEDALFDAEEAITDGGNKTQFTPEEERTLKEIRRAKQTVSDMARRYAAQMDYDLARMDEITRAERERAESLLEWQAQERAREESERARQAEEKDIIERNSYDTDYAMSILSEEDQLLLIRILADPDDPEELPERVILTYDDKGNLRPDISRYPLETEFAMTFLSEEDQKELTEYLTAPIPGTEHFDFRVGEVIPAAPRLMPKEITLAYDDEGRIRPAILLQLTKLREQQEADRIAEEARVAREQRIEELRTARREKKEAGTAPSYAEGASDLFAGENEAWEQEKAERNRAEEQRQREAKERAESLEKQRKILLQTEREEEAGRRHALAEEKNDPRYEWSFSRILRDSYERKTAAAAEKAEAEKRPVISEAELTTINIRARRADDENARMETMVLGSMEIEALNAQIRRLRPEWYENTWLPGLERELRNQAGNQNGADPVVAGRRVLASLPPGERYELMGKIADSLPVVLRENLRDRLLNIQPSASLPYEKQVKRTEHDRITELKGKEVEDRVAPENKDSYREALKLADEALDRVDADIRTDVEAEVLDRVVAQQNVMNKQIAVQVAKEDDGYRAVAGQLLGNNAALLENGILPVHEEAYDRIRNADLTLSPEYVKNIVHLLRRMEEMGIDPASKAEQTEKYYAFSAVAQAKEALREAVRQGDPAKIIQAADTYKKKRDDMRELVSYAQEHFSRDTAPGNVDNTRNPFVPWEFSQDYYATSQVNGVYQIYSALKRTGVTIREYEENPNAARRKMIEKLEQERTMQSRMRGKSIGQAVGFLMAETEEQISMRIIQTVPTEHLLSRADEMLTESDPDKAAMAENRMKYALLRQQRFILSRVRESGRNPFTMRDGNRGREVLGLLSVVSEADLNRDYDRMMCGAYYDQEGKRKPAITAEQYIASKTDAAFDYQALVDRGADIIRGALSIPGSRFNAVTFMEERQKALSMLLTARAADAGKPGFDLLEYELTHTAEMYDMMRQANPQMRLPALTQEQREAFEQTARRYTERKKAISKGFTRIQKNEIARRRRNIGNIGTIAANHLRVREQNRNQAEAPIRLAEEQRKREEQARKNELANRMLAESRLREREEEQRRRDAEAAVQNEKLRQEAAERNVRIAGHAQIPLVERMLTLAREWRDRKAAAIAAEAAVPVDHTQVMNAANEEYAAQKHLFDIYRKMATACPDNGNVTIFEAPLFRTLLTAELGEEQAEAIIKKLPGNTITTFDGMQRLTQEELALVMGALAASVPEAARDRIIAEDRVYVPVTQRSYTGSLYDESMSAEEREEVRTEYKAQTAPNAGVIRELSELRTEHFNSPESREQRPQFDEALDYADQVLRVVRSDAKDERNKIMHNRDTRNNAVMKEMHAAELRKEDNRYINELMEPVPGYGREMTRPRADKTEEIRRLKNERIVFDPEYLAAVVKMLRKMEEMNLINAQAGGEELDKVYGFRPIKNARAELTAAVRSKDKDRILQAVENYKKVKKDTDELMSIARRSFHRDEYMDNMDVLRNDDIPWEYGRDYVPASQMNAMFLFGNSLRDYGISIDEFERDPGAAIQKMEKTCQEKYASLNGYMTGKGPGAMAASAAARVVEPTIFGMGSAALGRHMRAVGGLILADPGRTEGRRERNYMLHMSTYQFAGDVNYFKQSFGLKTLEKGLRGRSAAGWEAMRALTVVEERDIDYDRMMADPPIAADGTVMEPFSLADYLRNKQGFDYAAQANRLEKMIADGYREIDRLEALHEQRPTLSTFTSYEPESFQPYQILKARQEALTELLILRAHEKDLPGYQALERELRELPERYEAMRRADPNRQMPALTEAEKDALKQGAKAYRDLTVNKAKQMDAEEKRIVRDETAKEKAFATAIRNANLDVERKWQLLGDLMERNAPFDQIEAAETAYTRAFENRDRLKQNRVRTIADDFKAGKLPEKYAAERIRQISNMNETDNQFVEASPVFGTRSRNAAQEAARRKDREAFLTTRLLENQGLKIRNENAPLPDSISVTMAGFRVPQSEEWVIVESAPQAQNANVPPQNGNEQAIVPFRDANDRPQVQGEQAIVPFQDANDQPQVQGEQAIVPPQGQVVNDQPQPQDEQAIDPAAPLNINAEAENILHIEDDMQEEPERPVIGEGQQVLDGNVPPQDDNVAQPVQDEQAPHGRKRSNSVSMPKVTEKSFRDLEKKLMKDNPQEQHKRKASVAGEQNQQQMEKQQMEKQQLPGN